jgi:histone deacetylase 11
VLPIVYHPGFNITLFGLERLHPFDSCKFHKVVAGLVARGVIDSPQQLVAPAAISGAALGQVHTAGYLQQLHTSSRKVAQVCWGGWCLVVPRDACWP